jgi:hypothetical protein
MDQIIAKEPKCLQQNAVLDKILLLVTGNKTADVNDQAIAPGHGGEDTRPLVETTELPPRAATGL